MADSAENLRIQPAWARWRASDDRRIAVRRSRTSAPAVRAARAAIVSFLTKVLTLLALGGMSWPAAATGWHPHDDIVRSVRDFVSADRIRDPARQRISVQAPDARLRVARCSAPLALTFLNAAATGTRMTVKVSCAAPAAWKIYVQATLTSFADVLVVATPLSRGHVLTGDDVSIERRNVDSLVGGYFTSPAAALGQSLRQSVRAGQVLTPTHLKRRAVVRRGQTVTLTAAASGVAIRMLGTALHDAAAGQRVAVRNQSSGRVVEGTADAGGRVRID